MPINIEDRYKLIFEEHHYASDFRMKILQGWCWIYAALAVAFVWVHTASTPISWIVPAVGVVITLLMWIADVRHRSATRASKDVGAAIERDSYAHIPENQRFFCRVTTESLLTHSWAIDIFAVAIIIALVFSSIYLFCKGGVLPS